MLAKISLDYSAEGKLSALDEPSYQAFREAFPALELPVEKAEKVSIAYDKRDHVIDLATTGEMLIDHGITFTIRRFESCRKVATEDRTVNIQIAIPNLLLFAVDEVTWMENGCTEELQRELELGWRILAVCPPANQRRPDYILGRTREARTA